MDGNMMSRGRIPAVGMERGRDQTPRGPLDHLRPLEFHSEHSAYSEHLWSGVQPDPLHLAAVGSRGLGRDWHG